MAKLNLNEKQKTIYDILNNWLDIMHVLTLIKGPWNEGYNPETPEENIEYYKQVFLYVIISRKRLKVKDKKYPNLRLILTKINLLDLISPDDLPIVTNLLDLFNLKPYLCILKDYKYDFNSIYYRRKIKIWDFNEKQNRDKYVKELEQKIEAVKIEQNNLHIQVCKLQKESDELESKLRSEFNL